MGIFIIEAIVILPFVKTSHEKYRLVNLPQKCAIFGKFTIKIRKFWEIYLKNMENLPFYRNISIQVGTLGKFQGIYSMRGESG
jgi:hypothetical protein